MWRLSALCLACLSVAGESAGPVVAAGEGQPPPALAIQGDDFSEWTIGIVKVENPAPDSAVAWTIFPVSPLPEDAASVVYVNNDVNFTGPPGKYKVLCTEVTIVNSKPAIRQTNKTVTILAQRPNPPNPGPNPPIPPIPIPPTPGTKVEVAAIIVEETSQAGAGRAAYLSDPSLQAFVKSNGHALRVADQNVVGSDKKTPPADWKPYLDRAKGKPLPYLTIIPKTGGQPLYEGALPPTPQGLIDLMKQVGGKG